MKKPTILILDDDHKWIGCHQLYLEREGFKCISTLYGEEAIDIALKNPQVKFGLIDEILYMPPPPQPGQRGELQKFQGAGVIRKIMEHRKDIQFIYVTSEPLLSTKQRIKDMKTEGADSIENGLDFLDISTSILSEESAKLRKQPGVVDIIHKVAIDTDPEFEYKFLTKNMLRRLTPTEDAEILSPRLLVGLGFDKETFTILKKNIMETRSKMIDFNTYYIKMSKQFQTELQKDGVLNGLIETAKEIKFFIETPLLEKIDDCTIGGKPIIKPNKQQFKMLLLLAKRSELQQNPIIRKEDSDKFVSGKSKKTEFQTDEEKMVIRDEVFGYDATEGSRKRLKGYQIVKIPEISAIKTPMNRLKENLKKMNLGIQDDFFKITADGSYRALFSIKIVLYPVVR